MYITRFSSGDHGATKADKKDTMICNNVFIEDYAMKNGNNRSVKALNMASKLKDSKEFESRPNPEIILSPSVKKVSI